MAKIIKQEQINVAFPKEILKDMKKYSKDYSYPNLPELIRESVREKLYGKNIKEQITNDFLKEVEKEKAYVFEEKKDLHEKLKKIANKF